MLVLLVAVEVEAAPWPTIALSPTPPPIAAPFARQADGPRSDKARDARAADDNTLFFFFPLLPSAVVRVAWRRPHLLFAAVLEVKGTLAAAVNVTSTTSSSTGRCGCECGRACCSPQRSD